MAQRQIDIIRYVTHIYHQYVNIVITFGKGKAFILHQAIESLARFILLERYHSGLRADGSIFWQREIWHTGDTRALGVILLLPIRFLEDGLVLRRSCLT